MNISKRMLIEMIAIIVMIAIFAIILFGKKRLRKTRLGKKQLGKNQLESFSFLMKPYLVDGDKIYIKTLDNKYWTAQSCGSRANINNACDSLITITDIPYLTSQFTFRKHIDGTFSLETYNNKYLKRCSKCVNDCDNVICGDGINPNLQTHKFVLIKNNNLLGGNIDDTISIKTDNGRFLDLTECNQTCGKVITTIGLSQDSRFIVEKIPQLPKKSPFSKEVIADLNRDLPKSFPHQMPFTQS